LYYGQRTGQDLLFTGHAYKTAPTKLSTQPYILEQGISLIDQGLRQITQGLAMNM
jgi:hypothetical protein